MCCRAMLPRSLLGHYAAYNRRDCFRATARTKVNHFVRSMQTRAPAQFGILRLAQLPPRIRRAKSLILWHWMPFGFAAHKQMVLALRCGSCSRARYHCRDTPPIRWGGLPPLRASPARNRQRATGASNVPEAIWIASADSPMLLYRQFPMRTKGAQ
jgi:hypothetical protein